jgi:hypothetical protein
MAEYLGQYLIYLPFVALLGLTEALNLAFIAENTG